jgi:GNAT superfamily N-acetyltransferase
MDEFKVGKASCNLSPMEQGSAAVRSATKIMTHLYVAPEDRNKGYAAKLMRELGKQADDAMTAIILEPNAYDDGMTTEQLKAFYKRFGFIELQKEPYLMVRIPVNPMLAMHLKTQAPRIIAPH